MKCLFAVVAAFMALSVVQAQGNLDFTSEFIDKMMACGQEMGITPDKIKSMIAAEDEQLGCVNACVLKKINGMVDGKIHEENLEALIDNMKDKSRDKSLNYEQFKVHLKNCASEVASAGDLPECQLARKFALCIKAGMEG